MYYNLYFALILTLEKRELLYVYITFILSIARNRVKDLSATTLPCSNYLMY